MIRRHGSRGGRARIGLSVVAVYLTFFGCGFSGEASRPGEAVLRMNNMAEPAHLDPAMQTVVEDQRLTLALFEGLLVPDPRTLEPIPGVAESWTVSADGRDWNFKLRECLWSNGDPVTSYDFLFSWRRVLTSPSDTPGRRFSDQSWYVNSPYAESLFCIAGAEAWYRGESNEFSSVGIRCPDDRTLTVRLARATPWFAELLCFSTFAPVHRATLETHREAWTRPANFVGNGPFTLAERRLGEYVRVDRNERYWDRAAVALEAVIYWSTDQIDTALDQYLAGETDWVRRFNPKKIRAWRNDPELSKALLTPEYLGTYFYRFNVDDPALRDRRVRRALALTVDRAAICAHVTGLGERPAEGLVPPCLARTFPWRTLEGKGLGFNPEAGRAALAEAGYPGGAGFPRLVLAYNSDIKNKAIAEAIQQMWKRHLGIAVELENREKRVHTAEERARRYQISRGSWIGDFNDPFTFLDFMVSSRANNRTGWHNAEYDRLVDASRDVLNETERLAMLARAEEILTVEDPPILPIFYFVSESVLRPGKFTGIHENARDIHPPKAIRPASRSGD